MNLEQTKPATNIVVLMQGKSGEKKGKEKRQHEGREIFRAPLDTIQTFGTPLFIWNTSKNFETPNCELFDNLQHIMSFMLASTSWERMPAWRPRHAVSVHPRHWLRKLFVKKHKDPVLAFFEICWARLLICNAGKPINCVVCMYPSLRHARWTKRVFGISWNSRHPFLWKCGCACGTPAGLQMPLNIS